MVRYGHGNRIHAGVGEDPFHVGVFGWLGSAMSNYVRRRPLQGGRVDIAQSCDFGSGRRRMRSIWSLPRPPRPMIPTRMRSFAPITWVACMAVRATPADMTKCLLVTGFALMVRLPFAYVLRPRGASAAERGVVRRMVSQAMSLRFEAAHQNVTGPVGPSVRG